MKTIKPIVIKLLQTNKDCRDNDNLLIAVTLQELYNTTDIFEISKITTCSVCESITRCRRLVQQTNPMLLGKAQLYRQAKQEEVKRYVKNV